MKLRILALAALVASPIHAQQPHGTIEIKPLDLPPIQQYDNRPGFESVTQEAAETAKGATVRALDKVSGEVQEFNLRAGDRATMGLIEIVLGECRYPTGNAAGDAFAWVEVRTPGRGTTDFEGWMIASSPALNALDHARYDVWVMRCTNA